MYYRIPISAASEGVGNFSYYYMFWNDNPPRKYFQIYNHIKKMSPIPIDPQINLPRECIIGPSPNAVIEKVPK